MKFKASLFLLIFFTLLIKEICCCFLNDQEFSVFSELIKELEIRHCIFVSDELFSDDVKRLSSIHVAVAYMNCDMFSGYIADDERKYYRNIGVVFKQKDLKRIEILGNGFSPRFSWFVFSKDLKYVNSVPYNCEFIAIQPMSQNTYELTEFYTVKNKFFSFRLGTWNNGLKTSNAPFYTRRTNLNQSTFSILTLQLDNIADNNPCRRGFRNIAHCQHYILIKDVASLINLKIHHSFQAFNAFSKMENLSSVDIINGLHIVSSVDVTNPLIFTPLLEEEHYMFIKYPRGNLRPDYYLQPFQMDYKFSILCVIIGGSALIFIIQKIIPERERDFVDNLFLTLENFCNQSGNDKFDNISIRIICISTRIAALITAISFGAVITSFFAVEIPEIPFTNLEEFVQQGQYKLVLHNDSFEIMHSYFRSSENPTLKTIYNNYTSIFDVLLTNDVNDLLCDQKNLVVLAPSNFEFISSCRLYRLLQPITMSYPVLIPSSAEFVNVFNEKLLKFLVTGIQQRDDKNVKMEEVFYFKQFINLKEETFRSIKIEQMTQVLLIPIFGIFVAAVLMLGEFLSYRAKFELNTKRKSRRIISEPVRA